MVNFTRSELWKNFQLGTELRVSGNFIYNGIFCFDTMKHFCYEDEIFEFLYNIAVGIERLQKITLILLEHNDKFDQLEFEKNLITHNHVVLNSRIKNYRTYNFGKQHVEFLTLLSIFYKSARYERFNLDSIAKLAKGRDDLIIYLEKYMSTEISINFLGCTTNSNNFKKFIGKVIGKICNTYFELINQECNRLNLYTDELPADSKASKIFWGKSYNFIEQRQVQKEIIKFLIQSDLSHDFRSVLDTEPPLNLEFYHTNYYIDYLIDFHKTGGVKEEIDELYCGIQNASKRLRHLEFIGDPYINLENDFDIE